MSLDQEQYEKLEAYVGGDLNPAARAEVEKQLSGNPQLRKLLAELVMTRDLVRGLPRAAAPADLIETFQGQIERAELFGDAGPGESDVVLKINRWPQYMSVAAVIFLALGLAGIIYKVVLPHNKPNGGFVMAPAEEGSSSFDDKKGYERDGASSATTTFADRAKSVSEPSVATGDIAPLASSISPMGVARDDTRSHVSSTDLRRMQSQLADTTQPARNPSDEPIVMLVRSDNPQHANAEVRGYLDANFIAFDTATQPPAGANRNADSHSDGNFSLENEAKSPAQTDRSMQRLRAAQPSERGLRQEVAQNADLQSQAAAPQPTSGPTFAETNNNEVAGRQQGGVNQRFGNSAGGYAYNTATTAPGNSQSPQVLGGGGGELKLGVNPQTQPSGGNIYRAMLTQRQLRDLNTKLQSQGNQWTELRGGSASDAIEGNPLANAINNSNAAKGRPSEMFTRTEKEKAADTQAAAGAEQPSTRPVTTLATANATLAELSKQSNETTAGRSASADVTTQPTTLPAKDELAAKKDGELKDEPREVVIVVNEQPIDLLGIGVPATQPAAAPAQTQPAAASQPATTAPAK